MTSRYYDVVNFARRVTAPGLYSWGFNDETCPPTSMYAAYNVITAPKRLMLAYDTGHRTTQEQVDDVQRLAGRRAHGPHPVNGRRTGLVSRLRSPVAFGRRCIPPGCVAPHSNTPGILARRALPAGRLAALGANRTSETKH